MYDTIGMDKINEFAKQEKHSNSNEVDIMFEVAYKRLFGDSLVRIEKIQYDPNDTKSRGNRLQKNGVDKVLHFEDRDPINVDEKLRKVDWGDLLLELESNTTSHRLGWLLNPDSEAELIAYMFEDSQRVIFIRHSELLEAYHNNAHNWVKNAIEDTFRRKYDINYRGNGYKEILAWNSRNGVKFQTYSISVPLKEIKKNVTRWRFYDLKQDITNYKEIT